MKKQSDIVMSKAQRIICFVPLDANYFGSERRIRIVGIEKIGDTLQFAQPTARLPTKHKPFNFQKRKK